MNSSIVNETSYVDSDLFFLPAIVLAMPFVHVAAGNQKPIQQGQGEGMSQRLEDIGLTQNKAMCNASCFASSFCIPPSGFLCEGNSWKMSGTNQTCFLCLTKTRRRRGRMYGLKNCLRGKKIDSELVNKKRHALDRWGTTEKDLTAEILMRRMSVLVAEADERNRKIETRWVRCTLHCRSPELHG